MKILCIDTSYETLTLCYVDLSRGISDIAFFSDSKLKHSEILLPQMDELLKKHNVNISDIDTFAAVSGPGSFTGVRIGVTTVKAFAFENNKKVIDVNSLECMAYNYLGDDVKIFCLLSAGHDNYYFGSFIASNTGIATVELGFLPVDKITLKINEFSPCKVISTEEIAVPCEVVNAKTGLLIAVKDKTIRRDFISVNALTPLYLKLSQAEEELALKENGSL